MVNMLSVAEAVNKANKQKWYRASVTIKEKSGKAQSAFFVSGKTQSAFVVDGPNLEEVKKATRARVKKYQGLKVFILVEYQKLTYTNTQSESFDFH